VGDTVDQLRAVLADNATHLSQLGEYSVDASRLIQFELLQADAFGSLAQRNMLGVFGRGWSQGSVLRAGEALELEYLCCPRPDARYLAAWAPERRQGSSTSQL
jgi:hypothetical protein